MEGIWPQKGVKGKDTKYMYLKKINSHNMIKLDNLNETEQSLDHVTCLGNCPPTPFLLKPTLFPK